MKMRVSVTAAFTAAATAALAGPAALAAQGGPGSKPAPPRTYQVTQKFTQFSPTGLTIKTGDTVVWTNKETDGTTHSVVQGNGTDIDSPDIQPGQQFTWKFDFPGEWDIVCRFHPAMFLTIKVVGKAVPGAKRPAQQHHETQAPPAAKPTEPGGSTIPGVTGLPIHPRATGGAGHGSPGAWRRLPQPVSAGRAELHPDVPSSSATRLPRAKAAHR